MKIIFLDGEKIDTIDDVHDVFAKELAFPSYYGRNLDALHDCLSTITGPTGVIIVNVPSFKKKIGRRAESFFCLMNDLTDEVEEFYLLVDPFNETRS